MARARVLLLCVLLWLISNLLGHWMRAASHHASDSLMSHLRTGTKSHASHDCATDSTHHPSGLRLWWHRSGLLCRLRPWSSVRASWWWWPWTSSWASSWSSSWHWYCKLWIGEKNYIIKSLFMIWIYSVILSSILMNSIYKRLWFEFFYLNYLDHFWEDSGFFIVLFGQVITLDRSLLNIFFRKR